MRTAKASAGVVQGLVLLLVLALVAARAVAQGADAGLVSLVEGAVTYTPPGGAPGRVQAYMKLREGDRIEVPAGAQVRVLFFDGGRQERWSGPAGFRIGKSAAEALSGKPEEVTVLPPGVPQRIAQVPQLVQLAKLGGVQLRGLAPAQRAGLDQQAALAQARAAYDEMRGKLPADDITPELYLYAVLHEYLLYGDMQAVVDEMLRRQPESEQAKAFAEGLRRRADKQ